MKSLKGIRIVTAVLDTKLIAQILLCLLILAVLDGVSIDTELRIIIPLENLIVDVHVVTYYVGIVAADFRKINCLKI
jgi:hypothetical protein